MTPTQRLLTVGARGEDVRAWQRELARAGLWAGEPNGVFDHATREATRRLQALRRLPPDGVVDAATHRSVVRPAPGPQPSPHPAVEVRREPPRAQSFTRARGDFLPPPPPFPPLTSTRQRQALFGRYEYRLAPTAADPERIEITDDWESRNLVEVPTQELAFLGVRRIRFHRRAAPALRALVSDWAAHGLLDRIVTYDGAFAPRLMRGSHTELSAHAFGSAFDLNAEWNPLHQEPAPIGTRGSVVELVALANDHGFYWGGHFKSRKDGMHFEVARL